MLTRQGQELVANLLYNTLGLQVVLCNGNWTLANSPNVAEVLNSQIAGQDRVPILSATATYNATNNGMDIALTGTVTPTVSAVCNRMALIRGASMPLSGQYAIASQTNSTELVLAPGANVQAGDFLALTGNQLVPVSSVSGNTVTMLSPITGTVSGQARVLRGTLIGVYIPAEPGQLIAGREIALNISAVSLVLPG